MDLHYGRDNPILAALVYPPGGGGGASIVVAGLYFILVRPSLLPEDVPYMALPVA